MSQPSQSQRTDSSGNVFRTAIDLREETRLPVIQQLNRSLADTTTLMSHLKFAHWNVKGMDFYQLHLLFDEVAEVLEQHADMIAERATSLGGQAMGTVRMAAANTDIPEFDRSCVTGHEFLEETTAHLANHAANLRAAIDYTANLGDEDTADLYTEISREVDQQLYLLESHLQQQPVGTFEQVGAAQGAVETTQQRGARPTPSGQQGYGSAQRITFGGTAGQGQQARTDAQQPQQGQQQQTQRHQALRH